MNKRHYIKAGLAFFLFGRSLRSKAIEDRKILPGSIRLIPLVDELRSTNNSICLNALIEIEASFTKLRTGTYNLYPRSADPSNQDSYKIT